MKAAMAQVMSGTPTLGSSKPWVHLLTARLTHSCTARVVCISAPQTNFRTSSRERASQSPSEPTTTAYFTPVLRG
eukprot:CAMPEP_0195016894 /NCGR_PEP_ID=MMETSP0326_2-20130528/25767_1 /TAXON_ID=2866 ORGANISM="Crypthecodinium cohnii, Strain Seligo" /NCGR_SAMPLE_ID=MMETSP0326_2 /ASSEMBLY_ACC=CAM_ASM_000348 /LENGTH=74 /DNA_ID=CAMNT_0040032947 /DNA_START=206 /DNA_END=430 /DNA_ORIENTATION=+